MAKGTLLEKYLHYDDYYKSTIARLGVENPCLRVLNPAFSFHRQPSSLCNHGCSCLSPGIEKLASTSPAVAGKHQIPEREPMSLNFRLETTETPIIPLLVGDQDKTLRMSIELENEGVFVNPVIPPGVSAESSLIRISVMASLSE